MNSFIKYIGVTVTLTLLSTQIVGCSKSSGSEKASAPVTASTNTVVAESKRQVIHMDYNTFEDIDSMVKQSAVSSNRRGCKR